MVNTIKSVKIIELPHYFEENGDLVVMEGESYVPFSIARVFAVRAPVGAVRGQHAHKACTQFLTCPKGSVKILCDDGSSKITYIIDKFDMGLLIPSGIWVEYVYQVPESILTVLCERPYEEEDYIRDYDKFKKYRGLKV
ncbi:MAG: sugar 3,4-ketoisomerase [Mobilitalea sp.]